MHQTTMSHKFSPKFTIATAYPMMFSSDDLRHVEMEMLHVIFADSESSYNLTDPANAHYFDTIETPTELSRWSHKVKQRMSRLLQLERIWEIGPDDLV